MGLEFFKGTKGSGTQSNTGLGLSQATQLFSHPICKKFGLPGLLFIGFVIGVGAPFWFTAGFVADAHLVQNQSIGFSGWGLGSKTLFVRAGQSVEVEVEVHEVKKGRLHVFVREGFYSSGLAKQESAYVEISSPGKKTLNLTAGSTGLYKIRFSSSGDYETKMDVLTGGKWRSQV